LALFGRLSAERAETLVVAGVQKPAQNRSQARRQGATAYSESGTPKAWVLTIETSCVNVVAPDKYWFRQRS